MAGRYPQGDFFDFESELPQEEKQILYKVREWTRESVLPIAVDYWNREEFPHELIPEIQDLNIISLVRGQGRSRLLAGLVAAEIVPGALKPPSRPAAARTTLPTLPYAPMRSAVTTPMSATSMPFVTQPSAK